MDHFRNIQNWIEFLELILQTIQIIIIRWLLQELKTKTMLYWWMELARWGLVTWEGVGVRMGYFRLHFEVGRRLFTCVTSGKITQYNLSLSKKYISNGKFIKKRMSWDEGVWQLPPTWSTSRRSRWPASRSLSSLWTREVTWTLGQLDN